MSPDFTSALYDLPGLADVPVLLADMPLGLPPAIGLRPCFAADVDLDEPRDFGAECCGRCAAPGLCRGLRLSDADIHHHSKPPIAAEARLE